ncbi:enoyl-CoA hydratase/isomerase family protein [Corynebacterium sp. 3HC-13]|uniref:enoyl-CoA hydratase/isomerase family protein n=1 Tax=Corynebacterium poyangense TaxID=2684405 RepID=UPI001CCD1D79|nr:enoyl-CoA hydratase/isomerase family protein [Corynebacterium poyangense]MBZ8177237.1 enoyl-CoA hydratase/isomerase family protein [Corynebacterium poyangense]
MALEQEFSTLRCHDDTHALVVELNRPQVRNAIDEVMVTELHQVCAELENNPRVMIITGTEVDVSGKGKRGIFASGADISQLRERRRDDALRGVNSTIFHRISALPMPVIAAIDGYALGGGLELALAADFRVATDRAVFGQPEAGLGIVAAAGALWRLKKAVGEPLAKQMILAGRTLNAQEALEYQLVAGIYPAPELMTAAMDLAGQIAALDPLAVRLSKQLFAMPDSVHPGVDNIAQAICFESAEKFARMDAFLEKRRT